MKHERSSIESILGPARANRLSSRWAEYRHDAWCRYGRCTGMYLIARSPFEKEEPKSDLVDGRDGRVDLTFDRPNLRSEFVRSEEGPGPC